MPREARQELPEDRERLVHILAAAQDAVFFAEGRTRADLDHDRMFARAMLHAIQEIGEAAGRVSKAGRNRAPDLPWGSMVQMRNILVHAYFRVNYDYIWRVVERDLPPLVRTMEAALADWPSD